MSYLAVIKELQDLLGEVMDVIDTLEEVIETELAHAYESGYQQGEADAGQVDYDGND